MGASVRFGCRLLQRMQTSLPPLLRETRVRSYIACMRSPSAGHPECPERVPAIEKALRAHGLDGKEPSASEIDPALVWFRKSRGVGCLLHKNYSSTGITEGASYCPVALVHVLEIYRNDSLSHGSVPACVQLVSAAVCVTNHKFLPRRHKGTNKNTRRLPVAKPSVMLKLQV